MHAVAMAGEAIEVAQKLKEYWDESGLDMHIAVKQTKQVAVSTKHWARVHYVSTELEPVQIWTKLEEVSATIHRKLEHSINGPYVFIDKLNEAQTQKVFDQIVNAVGASGDDISRAWQRSWDISDAVAPK